MFTGNVCFSEKWSKRAAKARSWHGWASHGKRSAPSTGSAAQSLPLPVEGPVRIGQRIEEFCAPPAQRWAPAARPARCIVGGCARLRSNRRGWLRWLPQVCLRPPLHESMHGMLMLLMLSPASWPVLADTAMMVDASTCSAETGAVGSLGAWFGSGLDRLQLVSRCGLLCVARTRLV